MIKYHIYWFYSNIVEYLSIADVGVLPSESEGLPLVLMEIDGLWNYLWLLLKSILL